MIEVWMHKETGELVIAYATRVNGYFLDPINYVLEPENGFCDIYPESIKDQFEIIGEW